MSYDYLNTAGLTRLWAKIKAAIPSDYVDETELQTAIANFITSSDLSTALADYSTTSQMNTAIQSAISALDGDSTSY